MCPVPLSSPGPSKACCMPGPWKSSWETHREENQQGPQGKKPGSSELGKPWPRVRVRKTRVEVHGLLGLGCDQGTSGGLSVLVPTLLCTALLLLHTEPAKFLLCAHRGPHRCSWPLGGRPSPEGQRGESSAWLCLGRKGRQLGDFLASPSAASPSSSVGWGSRLPCRPHRLAVLWVTGL